TMDGTIVCEHVPFNASVAAASGGKLFILPWLTNGPHSRVRLPIPDRRVEVFQGGRSCVLAAPLDHPLDRFRVKAPLYDARLPRLSRLLGDAAPGAAAIDVGANIGDTIALCRLEGCELRFVAVEASDVYLQFLRANMARLPELFR